MKSQWDILLRFLSTLRSWTTVDEVKCDEASNTWLSIYTSNYIKETFEDRNNNFVVHCSLIMIITMMIVFFLFRIFSWWAFMQRRKRWKARETLLGFLRWRRSNASSRRQINLLGGPLHVTATRRISQRDSERYTIPYVYIFIVYNFFSLVRAICAAKRTGR